MNLPMDQEKLENFIYHHINAWASEYVEANKDDFPDTTLYDSMDHEFRIFMQDLEQRFYDDIKPKFGEL